MLTELDEWDYKLIQACKTMNRHDPFASLQGIWRKRCAISYVEPAAVVTRLIEIWCFLLTQEGKNFQQEITRLMHDVNPDKLYQFVTHKDDIPETHYGAWELVIRSRIAHTAVIYIPGYVEWLEAQPKAP